MEMNINQLLSETAQKISPGYCYCGCGQKTKLAKQTNRSLGWIKGEPIKFVLGHSGMYKRHARQPITYGEIDGAPVAYISLTNKKTAIIDRDEEINLSGLWCCNNGYASQRDSSTKKIIRMHRLILHAQNNQNVDHINGNTLDNRRINLRIATQLHNCWNQKIRTNNKTGYKGVWWRADRNKWSSRITVNHKIIHLGHYADFQDAIMARAIAEKKWFKEYARKAT